MKRTFFEKLGDFVLGKGFYIVLFLCVATIGISGYYLIRTATTGNDTLLEPVTGNPSVTLPDSSANIPDPSTSGQSSTQRQPEQSTPQISPSAIKPDTTQTPASQAQAPTDNQASSQNQPSSQTSASAFTADPVYTWPVKGQVLRAFSVDNLSYDETMGDWRTHAGVDIAAEEGLKVLCTSDGTVDAIYQDDMMGSTIVVSHPNGLVSVYSNLSDTIDVSEGQTVSTGTVLGTLGSSAIAESAAASHLHLEMILNDVPVDPLDYLP